MIVLFLFFSSIIISQIYVRLKGSSPEVGSSNIKIYGLLSTAIAIESFRLLPPDKSFTFLSN